MSFTLEWNMMKYKYGACVSELAEELFGAEGCKVIF